MNDPNTLWRFRIQAFVFKKKEKKEEKKDEQVEIGWSL